MDATFVINILQKCLKFSHLPWITKFENVFIIWGIKPWDAYFSGLVYLSHLFSSNFQFTFKETIRLGVILVDIHWILEWILIREKAIPFDRGYFILDHCIRRKPFCTYNHFVFLTRSDQNPIPCGERKTFLSIHDDEKSKITIRNWSWFNLICVSI